MAKATVEVVTTKHVTLTLSQDEAEALLALTGAVASVEGNITGEVYDALSSALSEDDYYYQSAYSVGARDGGFLGSIYLHKSK